MHLLTSQVSKNYLSRTLSWKLLEDVLNQNETENQEKGRHGIQDKVVPHRRGKGNFQKESKGRPKAHNIHKAKDTTRRLWERVL